MEHVLNAVDDAAQDDDSDAEDDGPVQEMAEANDDDEAYFDESAYDPDLVEMWIETGGGVLRLLSRRAKTPVELGPVVFSEVMEGIAEYMDPEQEFVIEVFRDATNFPELS